MRRALSSCFFLSGIAASIYAIDALRKLSFVFGSTTLALGLTLSIGLGGLALGALWATRWIDRVQQPARLFGTLHLALAVLFPVSILAMDPAADLYNLAARSHLERIAQPALLLVLLLPPVLLMGATTPLFLAAAFARRPRPGAPDRLARVAGGSLAIYIAGAALGALLAGFVLLPYAGLVLSALAAGLLDLACAGLVASAAGSVLALPQFAPAVAEPPAKRSGAVFAIVALSGFCALLYGFVWMRSLEPIAGTSTWSFASMFATLLLGFAFGLALSALLAPKAHYPGLAVALTNVLAGFLVAGGIYLLPLMPRWLVALYGQMGQPLPLFLLAQAVLCGLAIFPPAAAIGATLPLAIRCLEGERRASTAARLYSIATLAAVAGALVGGVALIPLIGLRGALMLGIALNAAIAAIAAVSAPAGLTPWTGPRRWVVGAAMAAIALAPLFAARAWAPRVFATGVYSGARSISELAPVSHFEIVQRSAVQDYREDFGSTVVVNSVGSARLLWVDGATQDETLTAQVLMANLPGVFGRPLHDAFVGYLGSGTTAAVLAQQPLSSIRVVEPQPAVIAAARRFRNLVSDSRVGIETADPRVALAASPVESFDLIVCDDPPLWTPAGAKMTTREMYSIARTRLRKSGIFAQTVPTRRLSLAAIQSVLRTFTTAFPEVLVLATAKDQGELVLFGSSVPLRVNWDQSGRIRTDPTAASGRGLLMSRMLFGTREARETAGNATENSDGNGIVEFDSLANLYRELSHENSRALLAHAANPWDLMDGVPALEARRETLIELAMADIVSGDLNRASRSAADLRSSGNTYDADRLTGDVLYASDHRDEAVALWMKCIAERPDDLHVRQRLTAYYRLLRPEQRPKEYEGWVVSLAGIANSGAR